MCDFCRFLSKQTIKRTSKERDGQYGSIWTHGKLWVRAVYSENATCEDWGLGQVSSEYPNTELDLPELDSSWFSSAPSSLLVPFGGSAAAVEQTQVRRSEGRHRGGATSGDSVFGLIAVIKSFSNFVKHQA